MEEGKEKPFQTVDIVILLLITVPKDISTLVADLIVLLVPIGPIYFFLDKLFSVIVWAIIQIYFYWKTRSFGRPGLANLIGGMVTGIGVPGAETISTLIAIQLANHPNVIETVVKIGGAAAVTVATGGAGAPAAAGATGATGTAAGTATAASAAGTVSVARGVGTAEMGGAGAVTGTAKTEGALAEKETAAGEKTGVPKKPKTEAEIAASGETPEPAEELRKQLLEQTPQVPEKKDGDEEENMELADKRLERKTDGPKREML